MLHPLASAHEAAAKGCHTCSLVIMAAANFSGRAYLEHGVLLIFKRQEARLSREG